MQKKEKREAKAVDGFWPGTLAALYMRVIQAAVHALPPCKARSLFISIEILSTPWLSIHSSNGTSQEKIQVRG